MAQGYLTSQRGPPVFPQHSAQRPEPLREVHPSTFHLPVLLELEALPLERNGVTEELKSGFESTWEGIHREVRVEQI